MLADLCVYTHSSVSLQLDCPVHRSQVIVVLSSCIDCLHHHRVYECVGNPLDPPLRSRFQARCVSLPL